MLQDPVTGEINTNPKQHPHQKKEKEKIKTSTNAMKNKISKQDKFLDLRPLNKFHSKLLGSSARRLSVSPP
jgi:hypothetical protein